MNPPVWIIDTNVLISTALTAGDTCDQTLRTAIAGKIRLAWNAPMLAEYQAVLFRLKFGFSKPVVAALLAAFDPADQVSVTSPPTLPDPDDQLFPAATLATPDPILITNNAAHLPDKLCRPVRVLTPSAALKRL